MRLSDRLAEQLLDLISDQGLQPGDRLPPERQLALDLGASRPSVREAIRQLASRGLLRSRQGGGNYLLPPPGSEIDGQGQQFTRGLEGLVSGDPGYRYDVLEARHALEGGTAWHAALRATDQDRRRICARFDDLQRFQGHDDAALLAQADAGFHLAIAEASHNVVLLQMMRGLFQLLHANVSDSRQRMYTVQHTQEQLASQHEAVLQAILRGDAPAAQAAIWRHLEFVHTNVRTLDEDEARRARSSRLSSLL